MKQIIISHLQILIATKFAEVIMKDTNQYESIKVIPEGVWEATRPKQEKDKCTPATDLQGNGYPTEALDEKRKNP